MRRLGACDPAGPDGDGQPSVCAGRFNGNDVRDFESAACGRRLVAGVVLAAGSLLFPAVRQRAASILSSSGGEKHVAVLPFDNIGNDPANEAIAEGLMDSLTSKLSNLDAAQQSLWVVPSSVVRGRKVTDPSSAEKDLGANLVVKGSIRRDAKNV